MELAIPVNPLASVPPAGSPHQAAARGGHGRAFQSDLDAATQRGTQHETPAPSSPKTSVGRVESGEADEDSSGAETEAVLEADESRDIALHWLNGLSATDHAAPPEVPAESEGAIVSHQSEVDCAACAEPVLVGATAAASIEPPGPTVSSMGQDPNGGTPLPSGEEPVSNAKTPALPTGEPGAPRASSPLVSTSGSHQALYPGDGDAPTEDATATLTPPVETHEPVADSAEPIMLRAQDTSTRQGEATAGSSEGGQNEAGGSQLSEVTTTGIERDESTHRESGDRSFASDEQASQAFEFNGRADPEVGGSPPSTTPPTFVSEVRQAARGPMAEASSAPAVPGAVEAPVPSSASVRLDVPQIEGEPVRLHVSLVQHTVYARVVTSQVDVQDYLVRHQDRLAANLQSHGLEMGQLQVDVGARGQQHMPQGWTPQPPPLSTDRLNEALPALEVLEPGRLTERRSRLDVVA